MFSLQRGSLRFLHLFFGLLLVFMAGGAAAQTYPAQPVTIIAGFSKGGEVHRTVNAISQSLSQRLGQPISIENRLRGGSNVATEAVVRAPGDGYTLLVASTADAINATLYDNLTFNFMRDITPVAGLMRNPLVIVVNPAFPARTIPELIAYAKTNPGKLTMAGPTVTAALAATSFTMMTGLDVAHVFYSGAVATLKKVVGGGLQTQFTGYGAAKEYVASGKLRAVAVTSARRERSLPDIPTIGEFVQGYELSFWIGIGAPRNTSPEIVARLNREITASLSDSNVLVRLSEQDHVPMPMTAHAFGQLVADDTARLGNLVKWTGIKPQ